jgi:hypothetical protein
MNGLEIDDVSAFRSVEFKVVSMTDPIIWAPTMVAGYGL